VATAADVLPVTAWVEWAPGADPAADPTTYAWRSLTSDVMPVVEITRGRPDQFQDVPPAQMVARLLNDGRWIRLNPTGPFWGLLRRTTPFRTLARSNTNYALDRFGRTVANNWATADAGGVWALVGGAAADYSVAAASGGRHTHPTLVRRYTLLPQSLLRTRQKVRVRINQLSTGASQTAGLMCRYVDTSNHCRAEVNASTAGALQVRTLKRVGGIDTALASVAAPGLTHSASAWYWLLLEASEGAPRVKFWLDGTAEPDTWLIDGSVATAEFPAVAGQHGCMTLRETGNTNAGATFDFDDYELTDGPRARMTGNTGKLPPHWADQSMSQGYADLTVFGPLGRVQKQKALKSALFRGFSLSPAGVTTAAYWPCEDGSGSTRFASGLSTGRPIGGFTNIQLGGDSSIAGSDPLPVYGAGSAWATSVPPYAANTAWSAQLVVKLPASPSAAVRLLEWTTEGTIVRWAIELTPGSPDVLRLRGYNAAGTELLADAGASFVDDLGQELLGRQLHLSAVVSWVGATTTWGIFTYYAGSPTGASSNFAGGSTGAGGSGNITGVSHNASAGYPSGGYTLGHIYLGAGGGITLGYGSNGYASERTTGRFARLCEEQGIPAFVGEYPTVAGTSKQPMGPQRTAGVADLLKEVAETEAGRLVDGKLGHLTLQTRANRVRHAVNLTLDVALGQVSWPFTPADDDFGFKNSVSATSPSGARSLKEDPASIAADGEYQLSLSVAPQSDGDVDQHAAWRRWLGTWDEMRFAQLVIDLRAHPELIDAWLDCDIGSRIKVLHVPAGVGLAPDDLDLILEGYTETIDSVVWRVALNVVPARPWDVFRFGAGGNASRLGTRGSSLAAAAVAGNLHTSDFEAGVAGWTPTGGTFAASSAQAYDGVQAGLLTTTGAPSQTIARREEPVSAGEVYAATVRVYSVGGYSDVSCAIDWYDAGHAYLSTTNLGGSALAAGVWERRSVFGAAPVGAAFAQYGPTVGGSPVAGTAVWVDDTALARALSVATSAGPTWRQGVVDFDVHIGGEKVNFFYVDGSTPQGVGAIRSRNGVSKAQASGEAVQLWRSGVLAL
jgi:hypothetical protein